MLDRILHSHSDFDLVLLFLAVVFMPLISALAGAQLAKREGGSLIPRYWQTLARGWLVAVLVVLVWRWLGRPFSALGLDIPVGSWGRAGLGFVALAAVAAAVQLARLTSLTPEQFRKAQAAFARTRITPATGGELGVFLLVAVTAGIWEELLYRGFLIWFLLPLTGTAGAIVLSSLVFGLGHIYQGAKGVAFTALIGLLFAALYVFSQSLWWLMAAHALVDIYGGCLAWRIKRMAPPRAG